MGRKILKISLCILFIGIAATIAFVIYMINEPAPIYKSRVGQILYTNQEYFDRAAVSILELYENKINNNETVDDFSISKTYPTGDFEMGYWGDALLEVEGNPVPFYDLLTIPIEDEILVSDLRHLFDKAEITNIYVDRDKTGTSVRFVKFENLGWTEGDMLKYSTITYMYTTKHFTPAVEGYRKGTGGVEYWGRYSYLGNSWFYDSYSGEQ